MAKRQLKSIEDYLAYGDAVVGRSKTGLPTPLKPPAKAFAAAHASYTKAARAVEAARMERDHALALVTEADTVLDKNVLRLADAMVAAGLGTRMKPLAKFSSLPPSRLTDQPYKIEAELVKKMVTAISRAKPDARVKAACATCASNATAVERALAAVTAPQAAYSRALAARDALLPEWNKRLATLQKYSAVVWDENPGALSALFARPEPIQAPTKKRAKKKLASSTNGQTAPATTGMDAPQS